MFANTKITTIPLLNTSNVTNMNGMFQSCINLTQIPQLDTSNVTDMSYIFQSCSNLTTIPLLATSKVKTFVNAFKNCSKLSNDSLNIILQMLINATGYTRTKTLQNIGLSETQAQTCTTLSNWAACQEAGWTTGY